MMNAYVNAHYLKKIWTALGSDFGQNAGKKALIVRALYGLNSAGAAFRNHLAGCMKHMGYTLYLTHPDLWIKSKVKNTMSMFYCL